MSVLGLSDVHLWSLSLHPLTTVQQCTSLACLSMLEQQRLAQVGDPVRRSALAQSRAGLRYVLAHYLQVHPAQVPLLHVPGQRPRLAGVQHLYFSLSRSAGLALVGVARSPLGLDLECVDTRFRWTAPAKIFLAPSEQRFLQQLPVARRCEAFYKCWVSREAYLKGIGVGLSVAIPDFAVCPDPDLPPDWHISPPARMPHWWLHALNVGPTYRAVLACTEAQPNISSNVKFKD